MSEEQPAGPAEGKPARLIIELPGVDKRYLAQVWENMKQGVELKGPDVYIGRSMADHPEWFPIFDTIGLLEGDDVLPDGQNPFAHISFHVIIGSQVFHQQPPEAETFYRMRLRAGDDQHDVIHMMINVFQRHLVWTAEQARKGLPVQFELSAYAKTLRSLWNEKSHRLWQRLGVPPDQIPVVSKAKKPKR